MDKWNMHTFFGAKVEPNRIMQITDSDGNTDMLHILSGMYSIDTTTHEKIDILADFLSYAKQKEEIPNEILDKSVIQIKDIDKDYI